MSLKDDIQRLRQQNKSYRTISEELQCSKGTISYHCNRLHLAKPVYRNRVKHELDMTHMRLVSKQKYDEKRNRYFEIGQNIVRNNKNDITLIQGIMSYYCEGSKTPGGIVMANSDPILHNIFADFMNKYLPQYEAVLSFISYENGICRETVENYWIGKLQIKYYRIGKHYRKQTHNGKQTCPYGTCYIKYQGIKYSWAIVMGCIFELTGANFIAKYYQ